MLFSKIKTNLSLSEETLQVYSCMHSGPLVSLVSSYFAMCVERFLLADKINKMDPKIRWYTHRRTPL